MKKNELVEKENSSCACGCPCGKKVGTLFGVAVVSALLAFGACKMACCGGKVMVIDFDRVQQEAVAYKAILDEQRGYEEKLQAQLGVDAGKLQEEEKALAAKKGKLSETEFKKKAVALQKKAMDLQQQYRFQAQQILLASQSVAEKLQPAVKDTLDTVAKDAGASVVLNKMVALNEVAKSNDLTDAFIKALNETVKAEAYPNPENIQPMVEGQ